MNEEIDRLNAASGGTFRIVKAIEANLSVEGTLDHSPDEAAAFELVFAAPHAALRKGEDQTPRMLVALRQPRDRVLVPSHGRVMSRRAGGPKAIRSASTSLAPMRWGRIG